MNEKNNLDQFYTNKNVALKCLNTFNNFMNENKYTYHYILEPSAGTGSFFNLMDHDKRIGIDIEPKCDGVEKMNYFDFKPKNDGSIYAVIGNPPFGKISSQAIRFFNKSAEFANIIAFILPRTFKRVSVQNKLDSNFFIMYNEDLPLSPCCFTPKMNAKCCFQIWKRMDKPREKVVFQKTHKDFDFLPYGSNDSSGQPTPPIGADFVVKAYGSNCGNIMDNDLINLRPKSWHWIKANININELKKRFKSLDYSLSKDTVRQDSLGRQELIYLYSLIYN